MLALATTRLYAQGGGRDEIGAAGVTDPAAPGQVFFYQFSGVADDGEQSGDDRALATVVHCTNVSSVTLYVEWQVFSFGAGSVYTTSLAIGSDETRTLGTQDTALFYEDRVLNTGVVNQGSGRILGMAETITETLAVDDILNKLLCTVHVLDAGESPVFIEKLPLYDRLGRPIRFRHPYEYYLPIIMKAAS